MACLQAYLGEVILVEVRERGEFGGREVALRRMVESDFDTGGRCSCAGRGGSEVALYQSRVASTVMRWCSSVIKSVSAVRSAAKSQSEAQAFFEAAGAGDPHRLDGDDDGVACESLP